MGKNNGGRASGKNPTPESSDKSIKVKYISSPVMMEAKNPSQFKEIVQHYTGHNPNESYETIYNMYSNPSTVTTTSTNTSTSTSTTSTGTGNTTTTTTTTTEAAYKFFAYGSTHTNPQVGFDGYSWEEIAEWNRNR